MNGVTASAAAAEKQRLWTPIERKCLSLLQQSKTGPSLLQIHAFMLRHALDCNVNLLTKFITLCCSDTPSFASSSSSYFSSLARIRHARRMFDASPHRTRSDSFLCNSMMKAYMGAQQLAECICLYRHLRRHTGFAPDDFTFPSLAKSCGSSFAVTEGQEIHNHVLKHGFCSNVFVSTTLIDMYCKFGRMDCARNLFDEMPNRTQVSWTALLSGYAKCGDMDSAEMVFDRIPEKDTATFNSMIDAYFKSGDVDSARTLFMEMPEQNVVSWTSMIRGYCSVGDLRSAVSLFDAMPEKNLISWNTIIGGCCQNKRPNEALRLFHEMQCNACFEPDKVTIASVLPAIADLGALYLGQWVHRYVQRKGLDREPNVCTALVDMYAKCGNISEARRTFDEISKKETSSWNALINGFAVNGCAEEALQAFSEMKRRGFEPNERTMMCVLSACNHSGLVEEGKKWFKAMGEFGIRPQIEHYGCMVDLLGRAGSLEEAEELVQRMPYKANGIVLSSLLGACGYTNDVLRAEKVVTRTIKTEPQNDGNYIILRNLYAMEGRWKDVKKAQRMLRKNGSDKEVGCSVIEIDGRVQEFISGDMRKPQLGLILGQLWRHVKSEHALRR